MTPLRWILALALLLCDVQASFADEPTKTRIVITSPEGRTIDLQIEVEWSEASDPAQLEALSQELAACRQAFRDCERAGEVEVLRSPELFGTYLGILAGAFTAGFCAVRPDECSPDRLGRAFEAEMGEGLEDADGR